MRNRFVLVTFLLLPAAHAQILTGGQFSLIGHINSGGGISSGGAYGLIGEATLPPSGASTGGQYTIFSPPPIFITEPFSEYELDILLGASRQIQITWPAEATAYHLQFSQTVGSGANWQPVFPAPAQNFYSVTADQTTRFYRLSR